MTNVTQTLGVNFGPGLQTNSQKVIRVFVLSFIQFYYDISSLPYYAAAPSNGEGKHTSTSPQELSFSLFLFYLLLYY